MKRTGHMRPVRWDAASARAAHVLNAARAERDQLAAIGGPAAVARAAWVPGGPSEAELAAHYERLRAQP